MIPTDLGSYYRLHSKFYDVTRWAFLFGRNSLQKFFPELPDKANILDLGCGTGKHLKQLRLFYPKAEITGIDLSSDMLRLVNRSIVESVEIRNEYYEADTFTEDQFDLIVCSYSLTMMDDIPTIVTTIQNHLKHSGMLLVVDFDSTAFNWFSKWMKKNHVSFEANVFQLLEKKFKVEFKMTSKGWLGLYTFSLLLAKNYI